MLAGRLDRFVTIQRKTATQDDAGQPVETWTHIGTRRTPAARMPASGNEKFLSQQFIAREQVEFHVRYSSALSDLNPLDRVVYPALTPVSDDPVDHHIYDILAVHEIGRNEGFKVICARRAEV